MKVAIIEYNAGNVQSVSYALQRLGVAPLITSQPDIIRSADKVIFPGVGAAGAAMQQLKNTGLDQLIPLLEQPVLGICLGMQLMCRHSEENDTACLGIFPGTVTRLQGAGKVPHVGWNSIGNLNSPLFKGIEEGAFVYYVHSYCMQPIAQTVALTDYLQPFSASLQQDNFYAVQFHPEKSAEAGSLILQNFLSL